MVFHLPSLKGHSVQEFTKDFTMRTFTYGILGAAFSGHYLEGLHVRDGAIFSCINSGAVQLGHSIVTTDKSPYQKLLITAASLAVSTLLLNIASGTLLGRVGLQLPLKNAVQLAFVNLLGETITIAVPKICDAIQKPEFPQKESDVKTLSESGVKYLQKHYATCKDKLEDETLAPLHARFYALDLPIPENQTYSEFTVEITELPLPQTAKEVEALTKNKLSWLGVSMLKYGGFSKLDFPVQVAFENALATQIGLSPALTPKTNEDINEASEKTVRNLHSLYTKNGHGSKWGNNFSALILQKRT